MNDTFLQRVEFHSSILIWLILIFVFKIHFKTQKAAVWFWLLFVLTNMSVEYWYKMYWGVIFYSLSFLWVILNWWYYCGKQSYAFWINSKILIFKDWIVFLTTDRTDSTDFLWFFCHPVREKKIRKNLSNLSYLWSINLSSFLCRHQNQHIQNCESSTESNQAVISPITDSTQPSSKGERAAPPGRPRRAPALPRRA